MEKPLVIPRCSAKIQIAHRFWDPCWNMAAGELVYDKKDVRIDISWPYCKEHLDEFVTKNKNLWIDLYV